MNRQVKGDQEACEVAVARHAQTLVSVGTSSSTTRLLPVLREPYSENVRDRAQSSDLVMHTTTTTPKRKMYR